MKLLKALLFSLFPILAYADGLTGTNLVGADASSATVTGNGHTVSLSALVTNGTNGQALVSNGNGSYGTPVSIGTSGAVIPLLSTANTAGAAWTFLGGAYLNRQSVTYSSTDYLTTNSPLTLNWSLTGTATPAAQQMPYTRATINSDNLALGSGKHGVGLYWAQNFGGAAATGGRSGWEVHLTQTASTGNSGIGYDPFFTGLVTSADASFSEGGTSAKVGGAKGHNFALNEYARLHNGATNFYANFGEEYDVLAETGSSVAKQGGISIVHTSTHAVQGTQVDAGILMADQTGASAANLTSIQIGQTEDGQWPLDATNGQVLYTQLGTNFLTVPSNALNGVNLLETTFGGKAFQSRAHSIDNNGVGQFGTGYITPTSSGLSIDVNGSVGPAEASTISGGNLVSGGTSGFAVNDTFRDIYGGVYYASSVSGGVVTQLTVYRSPYVNGATPGNFNLTPGNESLGTGTVTINVTWTARNTLTLNPNAGGVVVGAASGGDKGIGTLNATTLYQGGTSIGSIYAPLASPTFTGIATTPTETVSGAVTKANIGVTGAGLIMAASTYTDSGSSGTVSVKAAHVFGIPTFTSNSATTDTDAATVYIAGAPVQSTNETISNFDALYIAGGRIRTLGTIVGSLGLTITGAATNINASSAGAVNIGTGTSSAGVNIGGSSNLIGFYGATAIVKATPSGACAGNTGCQALRDALGNLGLINTGSITN